MLIVTLAFLVYYLITQGRLDRESIFQFKFNDTQKDIESITISVQKNKVKSLYLHRDNGDVDEVVSNVEEIEDEDS